MDTNNQTIMNSIKKPKAWIIVLVVVILIALYGISMRNGFVTKSLAVDSKFSQIDVQLKRRFDLLPNLTETVKGLTKQEQEVFGKLAEARSHYAGATTTDQKAKAGSEYESALGRLLVITESYPELRSSEAFQGLMAELSGTENRIGVARKDYNDAVQDYNATVMRFPANIVASIFGFHSKAFFETSESERAVPAVKF